MITTENDRIDLTLDQINQKQSETYTEISPSLELYFGQIKTLVFLQIMLNQ